jgi:anti-anti-sigma regulatory factor
LRPLAEKVDEVKLVFADDLTASNLDWMRDQLAGALSSSDRVVLELGNTGNVDRSLVELLCSAHRVADSLGKLFTLGSAATVRRILKMVGESGYAHTPCNHRTAGCLYYDGSAGTMRTEEK